MYEPLFHDRYDAGRQLARRLTHLKDARDVIVLALPRGGVPVAAPIAAALGAPLDVFVVRKLGVPHQEELAMGAIASGGAVVFNPSVVSILRIPDEEIRATMRFESREVERRSRAYRGDKPFPALRHKTVVLVDDGIATGATMRVAIEAVRRLGTAKVIVAAPVMSLEALDSFRRLADGCECVAAPEPFGSVGVYYEDFSQTSDDEVRTLLTRHASASHSLPSAAFVRIPCGTAALDGDLRLPPDPKGLVVFAHGSGSSRLSKRNQQVAAALNARGFATLLFDLLSDDEEELDRETMELRFDIGFLSDRLVQVTDWLLAQPPTRALEIGYFGASTGAAAALVAAAKRPDVVRAVVSRGGRPDLADTALPYVAAATLLIVGGDDPDVFALNRAAAMQLNRDVALSVVPGATHLFEEPGALEEVARLAGEWFEAHVGVQAAASAVT